MVDGMDERTILIFNTAINQEKTITLFDYYEQKAKKDMVALQSMQIFLRVAELASFSQAADSLGLPKASVSTAVQKLEQQLGTRLLHRTTRKVQLTQDGQSYFERCKDLLADFDELQSMFVASHSALRGRLRVDMPSGIARHIAMPQLPDFLGQHPQLQLELSSTDRRVDVVREGFDCVVRVGTLSDSSLIAKPLGYLPLINIASRDYLQAYGIPQHADDLHQHRLIHYQPNLGTRHAGFEYLDTQEQAVFVAMAGAISVNNADAYIAACRAGLGLIQLPKIGIGEWLDSGELVEVLPNFCAAPMPVSLLYAHRRQQPKRVQVFMAWMGEILQPYLTSTSKS